MRKDTRKVIEARMVEAINALGGVAHTQDVKDKILELEGATYEDFGRTKPNTKYPEGRFRFVESFAHIAKKMKNDEICFSPRRFYISTDPNAEAPEKETKTVARKPRKKAEPVVEQEEVEETQTIPSSMSQDEEKEVHQPPMARDEDDIADSDLLDATSPRSIYAYLDREKEVRVEVDEKGRAWEVELTDEERAQFFPQNDLSPVEEAQEVIEEALARVEEAQEVIEEAQVEVEWVDDASVTAEVTFDAEGNKIDEEVYVVSEEEDSLTLEEVETFGIETQAWVDEEKEIRVGVDAEGLEYTRPIDMVETVKKDPSPEATEPQAEEYVLSPEPTEPQAEEYTLTDNSEDEPPFEVDEPTEPQEVEVLSQSDEPPFDVDEPTEDTVVSDALNLDDVFDDEVAEIEPTVEEAQSIFLELVEGNVWGAIEDGNVYLSDAQSGEVVLSFSEDVTPLDFIPEDRRKKQSLILADAKKKGLKGYTSKILKVIEKTSERALKGVEGWETHHVEGSSLGCFGAEGVDRTQCSQVCALSAPCMNAKVIGS